MTKEEANNLKHSSEVVAIMMTEREENGKKQNHSNEKTRQSY